MLAAMVYLWATGLTLINFAWLVLTLLGLPGNWLMIVTAALVAWWVDGPIIGRWVFVAVIALAVTGELVELVAGAIGSKRGGGTRWGAIGALVGGIAGALTGTMMIPIPVVGTILGAAGGAFAGATAMELTSGRAGGEAVRAGRGAAIGHVTGNLTKFALGCAIWLTLAVAAFV